MSTSRTSSKSGWVEGHQLPKGPNGRALCRWCNTEIPKGRRRTFCSDACVHEHRMRTDPGYARRQVFDRDQGICTACGLDTNALYSATLAMYYECPRGRFDRGTRTWQASAFEQFRRENSLPEPGRSAWHMDHILPVVEGGGECGMENLRTLCVRCHNRETAALARRRADRRKGCRQLGLLEAT